MPAVKVDSRVSYPAPLLSKTLAVAVVIGCLALAGASGVAAFAASLRGQQVAVAVATGWGSGDQHASLARLLFAAKRDNPPSRQILELARAGLRQSPISTESLAMTGIIQQTLGDTEAAARTMGVALTLSRRDLLVHSWQAQQFARQGDVAKTLSHISMALTTSSAAPNVMFPLLSEAIRDQRIQDEVAAELRKRPPWLLAALDYLTALSPHTINLTRILVKVGPLPEGDAFRAVEGRLLDRLGNDGQFHLARSYALGLKGVDADMFANGGFSDSTVSSVRGPFAWRGVDTAVVSGGFVKHGGWELEGSAAPSEEGVIAERTFFLPRGSHRVTARVRADGNADVAVNGRISCANSKDVSPVAAFRLGGGASTFFIPPNCETQRFTISLDSGTGPLGAQAIVADLQIARSNGEAPS